MTALNLTTTLAITKTVGKKRQAVGDLKVPMPDVEQIAAYLAAPGAIQRTAVGSDGIPEYSTDLANWVMKCIRGNVQATARNRIQPGTITLRPGASIPATLEDTVAPAIMGGNGEALAQLTELKKAFRAHVEKLGKAAKTQLLIIECFNSPKTFTLQPAEVQAKLEPYITDFFATVEDSLTTTQVAYFDKFADSDESEGDLFNDL
jgi:hypothetical protein